MNLLELLGLLCEVTGRPEHEVVAAADLGAAARALIALDRAGDDPFDQAVALAGAAIAEPVLVGTSQRLAFLAAADIVGRAGHVVAAGPSQVMAWLAAVGSGEEPSSTAAHLCRLCGPDLVRLYLDDIAGLALASPDEEADLWRRSRAGDATANERLIEANLQLVVDVARELCRAGDDLLDLIQEGNIALVRAVDTGHRPAGEPFRVVAERWVRAAIAEGRAA